MKIAQDDILTYILGDASAELEARVRVALRTDPACAESYRELSEMVERGRSEFERLHTVREAAIQQVMLQIAHEPVAQVDESSRTRRFASRPVHALIGFAAMLAIVGAIAFSGIGLLADRDSSEPTVFTSHDISKAGSEPVPVPSSEDGSSFVRFAQAEVGDGSSERPFATLANGISGVESGGTLRIHPGESHERIRIDKAVRLTAIGGPVRIRPLK